MTPQEKILLKERLELILPDWCISDELEVYHSKKYLAITDTQLNEITTLGIFVNGIYKTKDGLQVNFSELNK